MSGVNLASAIKYSFRTEEDAFPQVKHGREPLLTNFIVQVRHAPTRSGGGIHLVTETKESEIQNCTVGKVVAIAPLCFHDTKTGKPWPEGPSFKVGDYLQIPKFGGYRFSVRREEDEIVFVVFDHLQQIALIPDVETALAVTSYV